jgi:DNA polymerase III alpha subunit
MAFLTLEDKFNSFESVVFASVYEKYNDYINKGEMIFILGKVSESGENTFKLLCNEIVPINEIRNRLSNGLHLIITTKDFSENKVDELQTLIQNYPGSIPLYFEMRPNGNSAGLVLCSRKYTVVVTDELLEKLHNLLGKNNVLIKS